jgi:anti-sigma factor RsiW
MRQRNGLPSDAWMDARVEAYIDDTLSPDEQMRFEARVWDDPQWQEQVERARSIRLALQSRRPPTAPTKLTNAILKHASASQCSETKA